MISIHPYFPSNRPEEPTEFLDKIPSSAYETEGIVITQIVLTSNNFFPIFFFVLIFIDSPFKINISYYGMPSTIRKKFLKEINNLLYGSL